MKYHSTRGEVPPVDFSTAVEHGLAPDGGLYLPEVLPDLRPFLKDWETLSYPELCEVFFTHFATDLETGELHRIVSKSYDKFDDPAIAPIRKLDDKTYVLELFHGPTLAFKDVGARFMAQCLGYFNSKNAGQKVTVLVATSGDTGGAVANGFLGVEGIDVVILYPKGKVSKVQEQQLTTLGQNITALEVEGVFDDCQDMVKTAFLDQEITAKRKLTSANSINVARWLPQMLYYFIAYRQLAHRKEPLVFSVPSGNFGNICAGMIGQNMGLPIDHFIAATNINDAVPAYLETGQYAAVKTTPTISNAMDVGDPSNFVRIQKIYGNNFTQLKDHLSGYRFTDDATREAMREIYHTSSYIADPHGAVGYLGLKDYLEKHPGKYGVFLETAHPVKFLDTVEETLERKVPMPERIQSLLDKEKKSIGIKNYADLKSYLLS